MIFFFSSISPLPIYITSNHQYLLIILSNCIISNFHCYNQINRTQDMRLSLILLLVSLLVITAISTPLMIEQKEQFLQKIKAKSIAIIFYGESNSQEFHVFSHIIPTTNQLYEGIEFLYVPASKFKLNRPSPSISIYRKIGSGDWSLYRGVFNKQDIDKWIKKHIFEHLPQISIEELDRVFTENKKAFLLLDFGEFELIRSKIFLQEFCEYQKIKCFKLSSTNPLLNLGLKMFGLGKEDRGISKLALYNPNTERLELYSKDIWFITRQELMEIYEGLAGIVVANQADSPSGDLEIELHYEEEEI